MNMKSFFAAALVVVGLGSSAFAHTIRVTGTLSGAAEAPPNASLGTGTASALLDLDTGLMTLNCTFSGLTGNVTAAHIHGLTAAPLTGTAGVLSVTPSFTAFPTGVTAGTYTRVYDMTLASSYNASFVTAQGGLANAYNALQLGLSTGRTYWNIHTSAFGGGEIRAFLVPEPATAGLLASAGVVALRRRSRR